MPGIWLGILIGVIVGVVIAVAIAYFLLKPRNEEAKAEFDKE